MSDPILPNEALPTVTLGETPAGPAAPAVNTGGAAALAALARTNESAMASLTQPQREAVKAIANGDPVATANALAALSPTWVVEQPRQTALPPNGPPTIVDASREANPLEVWKELREVNPVLAARMYINQNLHLRNR